MRLILGERRRVPIDGPSGHVIAEHSDDSHRTYYRFTKCEEQVLLRFHSTAEFVADPRMEELTVHLDPDADDALLSILIAGPLIATRMLLDGHLVLHASALRIGEGALAFVGRSGMGKSTMAALGLAAGYLPITDDVLRVELSEAGAPMVWPGSTELRLRPAAQSLAEQSPLASRVTADGRTALATGGALGPPVPLHCCVIPFPDRGIAEPEVRVLEPFIALRRLLRFPRILGWQDAVTQEQQFYLLAAFCQETPVLEVRLPWGPPFSPALVPALLDHIERLLDRPLRRSEADSESQV